MKSSKNLGACHWPAVRGNRKIRCGDLATEVVGDFAYCAPHAIAVRQNREYLASGLPYPRRAA
jgi:hypothetical protein